MIAQKWKGLPIMSFVQVSWLISTSIVTAAKNKEVLLWKHRQKIALGAARGIRYLHEGGSSLSFTNVLTSVLFFITWKCQPIICSHWVIDWHFCCHACCCMMKSAGLVASCIETCDQITSSLHMTSHPWWATLDLHGGSSMEKQQKKPEWLAPLGMWLLQ